MDTQEAKRATAWGEVWVALDMGKDHAIKYPKRAPKTRKRARFHAGRAPGKAEHRAKRAQRLMRRPGQYLKRTGTSHHRRVRGKQHGNRIANELAL